MSTRFIPVLLILAAACTTDPYPGNGLGENPGPGPTDPDTCDPAVVYFEQEILPLITSNCAKSGCHDATGQDGVILTDYNSIINTGEVVPGNPGNSELYETITETDLSKRMPPPPEAALTVEQIQTIAAWITQGAQNNSCASACDTSDVRWSTVIEPLIAQNCRGCHQGTTAQGGINLETYAQVNALALNGTLLGVVRYEPGFVPMPYGSNRLNDCKVRQIELWVQGGALQN